MVITPLEFFPMVSLCNNILVLLEWMSETPASVILLLMGTHVCMDLSGVVSTGGDGVSSSNPVFECNFQYSSSFNSI